MWADDAALDAAESRIDDWESAIAARAAKTKVLSQRLAGTRGTARSDDGLVEATVDSAGGLIDLRLDERTRGQSAEATARQIVRTVRAAYADLVRQVSAATEETLGPDDAAGRAIVDSYRRRLDAAGTSHAER